MLTLENQERRGGGTDEGDPAWLKGGESVFLSLWEVCTDMGSGRYGNRTRECVWRWEQGGEVGDQFSQREGPGSE